MILKFESYTYSDEVDSRCSLNLQLKKKRKYKSLNSCLFRCAKGKQKVQITHQLSVFECAMSLDFKLSVCVL